MNSGTSTPINILFRARVKPGREAAFHDLAANIAKSTHDKDDGCITFTFHQSAEDARNFFVYEQWRDEASMNAHFARLLDEYGPPSEGGVLPSMIQDFFEEMHAERYHVIEPTR